MVVLNKPIGKGMRTFISLGVIACGAFAIKPVHGAVVTLQNGDQVTGEVRQMVDGMLVFATSMFGEIKIPWDNVAKLVSDQKAQLQLNDGTEVKGAITLDDAGLIVLSEHRGSQLVMLAKENVVAVNPPIVDPAMHYSGRLDFGGTANRGNTTDDQLNLNGELVARTPIDRYTLAVEAKEAKSGATRTASNQRILAQYDIFLKNKNYVLVNAKTESDRFADLNSRSSVGFGYGYQFVDTEITQFSGEAGLSYVYENYAHEANKSFPAMSLGLKYDRQFFDNKLIFFQNLTMDMSVNNPGNTLWRNRMGIRVPIAQGMNVSTQFNVDYNNDPAIDKKKADSAVIVSVGYAF